MDHFHAVPLANQALDEVRRRTQQTTLGHCGRKDDPLYRIRPRLLAAHDRRCPGVFERMLVLLHTGDPSGEVASAYLAKELLRDVYASTDTCRVSQGQRVPLTRASSASAWPLDSPGAASG